LGKVVAFVAGSDATRPVLLVAGLTGKVEQQQRRGSRVDRDLLQRRRWRNLDARPFVDNGLLRANRRGDRDECGRHGAKGDSEFQFHRPLPKD
jgi:hypothetical protein